MDGWDRGRSPWSRGRAGARGPAPATPESPWAALDRRRDTGPRRFPLLVLAVVAAAVLLVGVAVGGGTPLISHGGLVSVADGDDADSGSDDPDDSGSDDGDSGGGQDDQQDGGEDEFPGRDEIGRAGADEYVDITDVDRISSRGEGGDFSGGSYSVRCALSDHKNSDNPIIAPGVRNGAQHTHDYAGNESTNFASEEETLEESSTTCTNGDRSPIFWPVLRDLRGVGPDVGVDGGSLDGNVGSFVAPDTIDITFHGHGSRRTQAMPPNMVLVTGSAKAGTDDGEGANAKYSCSGSGRLTDQYPICPEGSSLMRVFDFPSCWNGEDLDSEDHTTHIVYPDEDGECDDDAVPVPALRITVGYQDPPPGRLFAIDSFPEQQHDPITDHTLLEYLSSERRAQEGVECINAARRCVQGRADDAAASGSTDDADRVPRSQSFAHVLATHGKHGARGGKHGAAHGDRATSHPAAPAPTAPCAGTPPALLTAPGWAPPPARREHAMTSGAPALVCCC
ncbi:DUF1996 domain-containing protein [Actinomycetospora sp. CA-101289]|uniref:DUF1996 domain-containing protein n=1 Tax=Actinomycetospora sp. CA-101289 TaxID=3239893 RepID=UPI003D950D22